MKQVKQVKVDELFYFIFLYPLYYTIGLISGDWEDDRVNDGAKQVKQVIR